jgi:hypothetical protein
MVKQCPKWLEDGYNHLGNFQKTTLEKLIITFQLVFKNIVIQKTTCIFIQLLPRLKKI